MDIYSCQICAFEGKSQMSLARHFSQAHKITSQEYYDTFLGSPGKCIVCEKPTKYINVSEGYRTTCSHKCGGVHARQSLSIDKPRNDVFKAKVKENQINIWANRSHSERKTIGKKIGISQKKWFSKSSKDDILNRCSRYRTCDKETIKRVNEAGKKQCLKNYKEGKSGYVANIKGKFSPKNPEKYKGDPTNIIFRSSWELRMMRHLDDHPNVVQWSSEEFFIPYRTKLEPNKWRRYFPDFWVRKINKEGKEDIVVIEVKPKKFTVPPKVKKKVTRTYLAEVQRWDMNSSKWEYAKEYCEDRKWKFVVMTEESMGINF